MKFCNLGLHAFHDLILMCDFSFQLLIEHDDLVFLLDEGESAFLGAQFLQEAVEFLHVFDGHAAPLLLQSQQQDQLLVVLRQLPTSRLRLPQQHVPFLDPLLADYHCGPGLALLFLQGHPFLVELFVVEVHLVALELVLCAPGLPLVAFGLE